MFPILRQNLIADSLPAEACALMLGVYVLHPCDSRPAFKLPWGAMRSFFARSSVTGTQVQIRVPSILATSARHAGVDDRLVMLEVWAYNQLKRAFTTRGVATNGSERFQTMLEYSLCSPIPYVVLSLNNAPTLLQHIAQHGAVTDGFRDLAAQLLVALGHLHACRVCHLAVCPANITYGFDGHMLLVNLQHSMPAERDAASSHTSPFIVHYGRNTDAPELWCKDPSSSTKLAAARGTVVDRAVFGRLTCPSACDVWSAGWTLWYAFSGHDLFCPVPLQCHSGVQQHKIREPYSLLQTSDAERQHAILQYCRVLHACGRSPTMVRKFLATKGVGFAIMHDRMHNHGLDAHVSSTQLHLSRSLLLSLCDPVPALRPAMPPCYTAAESMILAAQNMQPSPSSTSALPRRVLCVCCRV